MAIILAVLAGDIDTDLDQLRDAVDQLAPHADDPDAVYHALERFALANAEAIAC